MSDDEILTAIQSALRTVTANDDMQITKDSAAADVEGWDSLANVRLFIELENTFDTRFKASDIERFSKVGDIIAVLRGAGVPS